MLKVNKFNIITTAIKSLLWAFILTFIVACFTGYNFILVNGWSSQPYIKYRSLIVTQNCKLQDLKVGDYITHSVNLKKSTFSLLNKGSYVTHQIIAIKTDGTYFTKGEEFVAVFDGVEKTMVFGYELDENGNVDYEQIVNVPTDCNIITMQRQQNKASFDLSKDYRNYNKNFVGKVIYSNYPIGNTLFVLQENKMILVGIFGMFVLLLVWKDQMQVSKYPKE